MALSKEAKKRRRKALSKEAKEKMKDYGRKRVIKVKKRLRNNSKFRKNDVCNHFIASPYFLSGIWTDVSTTRLEYLCQMNSFSVSTVVNHIDLLYKLGMQYTAYSDNYSSLVEPYRGISLFIRLRMNSSANSCGLTHITVISIRMPMAYTDRQRTVIGIDNDQNNYNNIYKIALAVETFHINNVKCQDISLDKLITLCEETFAIEDDTNNNIRDEFINRLKDVRNNDAENGGSTICKSLLSAVGKCYGPKPIQDLLLASKAIGMGSSKTGQQQGNFNVNAFEHIIGLSGMVRSRFLHAFFLYSAHFDGSNLTSLNTHPVYLEFLLGCDETMLDFFKKYISENFPLGIIDSIIYQIKGANVTATNPRPKRYNLAQVTDFKVAKFIIQKWYNAGAINLQFGVPLKSYHLQTMLSCNNRRDVRNSIKTVNNLYSKIHIMNLYRGGGIPYNNEKKLLELTMATAGVAAATRDANVQQINGPNKGKWIN